LSPDALDLVPGLIETAPDLVPLRSGKPQDLALAQPAQGAARDRAEHVKVPQQLIDRSQRRGIRGAAALLACAQVQLWVAEHQLARLGRARAVALVQLAHLARAQILARDRRGEAQGTFAVGARQRQQVPHRRVRVQLATTHPLLDLFGKLPHQTQTPAGPAATAIEAPSQLLQRKLETHVKLTQ
jgi:hypothetical protein